MLTITPIKTGFPNYTPAKQQINTKNEVTPNKTCRLTSYPAVYFTGSLAPDRIERPPFKESTVKTLDNLYDRYQKELEEVSIDDINTCVDSIKESTQYSKPQILDAMQTLTQFGNMKSLTNIGIVLDNNNVGIIANDGSMFQAYTSKTPYKDILKNNFGVNAALDYLIEQKENYMLGGGSFALFLDKHTIDKLEKCHAENPQSIKSLTEKKNMKLFYISGIEDGISFFNRGKDLKEETEKLLEKASKYNISPREAMDKEDLDRLKKLGINPIIIKNNGPSTVEHIYKQLAPEKITRKELNAVLDAAAIRHNKYNPQLQTQCKDGLAQYLSNKMDVYTPERISSKLKNLHQQIEDIVTSKGKTMDDVIYLIPEPRKSYDLIAYQYHLINKTPTEQFRTINSPQELKAIDIKDKAIVILDDCSLSGSSLMESETFLYDKVSSRALKENANIIFAPILVSDKAEERVQKNIRRNARTNQDFIIKTNDSEKTCYDGITDFNTRDLTEKAVGDLGWRTGEYCVIFPYMCPDNNTELAANIGLFHNINYRNDSKNFDSRTFTFSNIKTFYTSAREIFDNVRMLLNTKEEGI